MSPFEAQQANSDGTVMQGYISTTGNADSTLQQAMDNYMSTVMQIENDAMMNGTAPDQGALDAAETALLAAQHQHANAYAGAVITADEGLGADEETFSTQEGPLYVTEQDAIATAIGNYLTNCAAAGHIRDDNEAGDAASDDTDDANIMAAYQNDVMSHWAAEQLSVDGFQKTLNDTLIDDEDQFQKAAGVAWAKQANSDSDAAQLKAKNDADAEAAYNLAIQGPWQIEQKQEMDAFKGQVHDYAVAQYNDDISIAAAIAEDLQQRAAAYLSNLSDIANAYTGYMNTLAPAWAAAVTSAAGGDPDTATWANDWASYLESVASEQVSTMVQELTDWINTGLEDVSAWQAMIPQIAQEDENLSVNEVAAYADHINKDAAAIVNYHNTAIPADQSAIKAEVDQARGEITQEINATQADVNSHADNEDTDQKAYNAAVLAWYQTLLPVAVAQYANEMNETAADVGKLAQNTADMTKKVDTANEKEIDDDVTDGETLVDSEAKANKDYAIKLTQHEIDSMQASLIQVQQTIAAEPDSDFSGEYPGTGSTVGMPGIYINCASYHVEFALPLIDGNMHLTGFNLYSFAAAPGWQNNLTATLLSQNMPSKTPKGPTYDPEAAYDYFLPTTYENYIRMLKYANTFSSQMQTYSVTSPTKTCVGFVNDTMKAGNVWPLAEMPGGSQHLPISGNNFGSRIENWIPNFIRLPGWTKGDSGQAQLPFGGPNGGSGSVSP